MVEKRMGMKVRNKFIGTGKINSLSEWGQIIKKKVELRFGAINYNGPIGETVILKTKKRIKSDSILVKTNTKKMSSKPKNFRMIKY